MSPYRRLRALYVVFAAVILSIGSFIALFLWFSADPKGVGEGSASAALSDDPTTFIFIVLGVTLFCASVPLLLLRRFRKKQ